MNIDIKLIFIDLVSMGAPPRCLRAPTQIFLKQLNFYRY